MTWEEFVAACIPAPVTVTVEPLTGTGGYGPTYGTPAGWGPCVVEHTARMVRVQTGDIAGVERVGSATVYGPSGPEVPAGSRVTLPGGAVRTVLAVSRHDPHGLPLPAHQEVVLE